MTANGPSGRTFAIRTLWITRKDCADYPPGLIEAWDEWSLEENWDGWKAACDDALASIGSGLAEFRYVDIVVPVAPIHEAFEATRAEAVGVAPVEERDEEAA
jgi:hypothetical protein